MDFSIPESQTVRADVYNILGQRVLSEELSLSAGNYSIKLSMSHLSAGIYFLRLQGNERHAIKLMKIGGDILYDRGVLGRGSIKVTAHSGAVLPLHKTTGEDGVFTIRVGKYGYETWSVTKQIESDMEISVPLTIIETTTVTDIDGNIYQAVKIGNQWWMAENLRVTRYRNGDAIPTNLTNTQWENTTSGAYAIHPHIQVDGIYSDEEMVAAYGKLYNWYAVDDDRGLCPEGWHVPSDAEWWTALVGYVVAQGYPYEWDNPNGAGNALKSRRQVNSPLGAPWVTSEHPRWNSDDTHYGLDVFGFSGLPGGYRVIDGFYTSIEVFGIWWSSSERYDLGTWFGAWHSLYFDSGYVGRGIGFKQTGGSVRCLRDD